MIKYAAKRVALAVFILLCTAFLSFALICFLPGEGEMFSSMKISIAKTYGRENLERIYGQVMEAHGLDEPWIVQFYYWLKNVIVRGSFGASITTLNGQIVGVDSESLMARHLFRPGGELMMTLIICGSSFAVAMLFSVVLGALTFLRGGRWLHIGLMAISTPTLAVPGFVFAGLLLLLVVKVVDPQYANPGMWGICSWEYIGAPMSWAKFVSCLGRLAPIWIIVGMPVFATGLRVFRAAMLDQLGMPYITVARARGAGMRRVLMKHAMRNALNPLITSTIDMLPTILVNTMFVGFMFGIRTYGDLLERAVSLQDPAPLAMLFLFYSFVLVVGNMLADIGIALADPRIRYA